MKRRKIASIFAIFSQAALTTVLPFASASVIPNPETLVSTGNVAVRPTAIEKIIRELVASAVSGSVSNSRVDFQAPAMNQDVKLPVQTGTLKDILDLLGIKDTLHLNIAPIQIGFLLPDETLKIAVVPSPTIPNNFNVTAQWGLTALRAQANRVSVQVPKGLFDRAFSIDSNGSVIQLKPNSTPIQFSLALNLDLTENGVNVKFQKFASNLNAKNHPEFLIKFGKLTVEKNPLTLDILSNGHHLTADEPTIRTEFQKLGETYSDTLRIQLAKTLENRVTEQGYALAKEPPVHFELLTDKLMANSSLSPALKNLIGGIDVSFVLSYFQSLTSVNMFSAQIATHLCLDGSCLYAIGKPTKIGTGDLKPMSANDAAGAVIYESALQNIIGSHQLQDRIRTYFDGQIASPGVVLSPAGVKTFLDATENSVVAIINLEIDIKKTADADATLKQRLKLKFGDTVESLFGSGKIVKIPVAVHVKLGETTVDDQGNSNLKIKIALPFDPDHTFHPYTRCSAADCPTNVDAMTKIVKSGFMESVHEKFLKALPTEKEILLGPPISFKHFLFKASSVSVSENRGLLVTTEMLPVEGEKK